MSHAMALTVLGLALVLVGAALHARAHFALMRAGGRGLDYISFRQALRASTWHRTYQLGMACHAVGVSLIGLSLWLR